MTLSHHQQHQLHRIETGLLRSDPPLTAMLGIFGRLSAGQAMPAWEQVPTRQHSIQQAAALSMKATIVVADALVLLLRAVLALLIAAAGTRHGRRLPAPGPSAPAAAAEPTADRTRPTRPDRVMSTLTARAAAPMIAKYTGVLWPPPRPPT